MDTVIRQIKKPIKSCLRFLDLREKYRISRLKKQKRLLNFSDLRPFFQDKSMFAFATGGSLANIRELDKLANKNVLIMTTGIVHFYRLYGVMPNLWFVHNPDSVEMTLQAIKQYKLQDTLSFENTFILVPSNTSEGKVHFSSPIFKEFRSFISEKSYFVLYHEELVPYPPDNVPPFYLDPYHSPIQRIDGSAVENVFLPFLNFIGVKEFFFSGVDYLDHTGHFWNRNELYQNKDGQIIKFDSFVDDQSLQACSRVAIERCKQGNIQAYRLEKEETRIKQYPLVSFETALAKTSAKICPKDII